MVPSVVSRRPTSPEPFPGLELRASLDAPFSPSTLFTALTSGRLIERWWGPEDVRTTVLRFEPRSGGAVVLRIRYLPALVTPDASSAFRAAGVPISFDLRGTLAEFVDERVVEFDLELELGRSARGIRMVTRFELEPTADGTRLTGVARGESTPHWVALGQRNLESQLERIVRVSPR